MVLNGGAVTSEWIQYRRVEDVPAEAMRARFTSHVYHRHSHETYSIGVTETGAQAFKCRHGTHVSAAGQVMAFNPDDPHDGQAGSRDGFVYRMVHIQPEYFTELLPEPTTGWPLFRSPVIDDPALAGAVTRLHTVLAEPATSLARYEALATTARLLLRDHPGRIPVRRRRSARWGGSVPPSVISSSRLASSPRVLRTMRITTVPDSYTASYCSQHLPMQDALWITHPG
jgi:hypothetical protein